MPSPRFTLGVITGLRPCANKEPHATPGKAAAALRAMFKRPPTGYGLREPESLNVYGPCRYCGQYHIGHDRKRRRRTNTTAA